MSKLKNGIGINFDILYRIGKLKGHAAPQVILASNEEGTIEIGDRTRVQRCHGKDVTARREITMKVLSRLRRRSMGLVGVFSIHANAPSLMTVINLLPMVVLEVAWAPA